MSNSAVLELLEANGYHQGLLSLLRQLRTVELASELVPLSDDRKPFAAMSDEAIIKSVEFTLAFPERLGRLSQTIRRVLGICLPCPVDYIIKESHFDVSAPSQEMTDRFICLGFEPDHFATLNPPEYRSCFTAKFEIDSRAANRRTRLATIDKLVMDASLNAQKLVEDEPGCFGYLEIESYSSKNKFVYDFRPLSPEGVENFPFRENEFVVFTLPATREEAANTGLPLNGHKIVDVHVKVPTPNRGAGFEEAATSEMEALRELFLLAGFYEIYSEAGNFIYTVQSFNASEGKRVFDELDRFARKFGGISGLKLEICKYFWRKCQDTGAEVGRLSPVPPLTRRLSTSILYSDK